MIPTQYLSFQLLIPLLSQAFSPFLPFVDLLFSPLVSPTHRPVRTALIISTSFLSLFSSR